MPLSDSPIFVFSTGRAGSTLLQKLMNTHRDLAIFGEHAGFLNGMSYGWSDVMSSSWVPEEGPSGEWLLDRDRNRPLRPLHWAAWDGSFDRRIFHRETRAYLDALFAARVPEGVRWGFKEIRYSHVRVARMLADLYPGAQFILLMRDPVDACTSFSSASMAEPVENQIELEAKVRQIAQAQIKPFFPFMADVANQFGERVTRLFYEDLETDPWSVMRGLAVSLGLEEPFTQDRVASIASEQIVSERQRADPEFLAQLRELAGRELPDEREIHQQLYGESRGQDPSELSLLDPGPDDCVPHADDRHHGQPA